MNNFIYEEYDIFGYQVSKVDNKPEIFDIFLKDVDMIETPNIIPKSIIKTANYYDDRYEYIIYDTKSKKIYLASDALKNFIKLKNINGKDIKYENNDSVMFNIKRYRMIEYLNKINKTEFITKKVSIYFSFNELVLRPDLIYSMLLGIKSLKLLNSSGIAEIGKIHRNIVNVDEFNLKEMTMLTILYFDNNINTILKKFKTFFNKINNVIISRIEDKNLECYMKRGWTASIKYNETDIIIGRVIDRGIYDFKIIGDDNFRLKKKLNNPIKKKIQSVIPNKKNIYNRYPAISKDIIRYIIDDMPDIKDAHYVSINNRLITLTEDMIDNVVEEKVIFYEEYVPDIIELSINIDRLKKLISQTTDI